MTERDYIPSDLHDFVLLKAYCNEIALPQNNNPSKSGEAVCKRLLGLLIFTLLVILELIEKTGETHVVSWISKNQL